MRVGYNPSKLPLRYCRQRNFHPLTSRRPRHDHRPFPCQVTRFHDAADRRAGSATYDRASGRFTLPPRPAVVFVVR